MDPRIFKLEMKRDINWKRLLLIAVDFVSIATIALSIFYSIYMWLLFRDTRENLRYLERFERQLREQGKL